jgi:hypothetical protein
MCTHTSDRVCVCVRVYVYTYTSLILIIGALSSALFLVQVYFTVYDKLKNTFTQRPGGEIGPSTE